MLNHELFPWRCTASCSRHYHMPGIPGCVPHETHRSATAHLNAIDHSSPGGGRALTILIAKATDRFLLGQYSTIVHCASCANQNLIMVESSRRPASLNRWALTIREVRYEDLFPRIFIKYMSDAENRKSCQSGGSGSCCKLGDGNRTPVF